MKKFILGLAILGFACGAANAQTQIETPSKYTVATNSFWSNWFIQVGVDMSLQNPYGEDFSDVFPKGKSFGVDVALGKWFTPGVGLRLKLNWENGIIENGHFDWLADNINAGSTNYDGGGYATLDFDVLFNMSNLLCGYSDSRVWNLNLFPRAGLARNFDANSYGIVIGAGIQSTWRLSKHFGLYLEGAYNFVTEEFSGKEVACGVSSNGYIDLDLGVIFYLGEATFKKAVTLDQYNALAASSEEALAKLRAELDRERQINADLRAELAKKPKELPAPEPKTVVASSATSVFFEINSSKINSQKDVINLEAIAATAKETGAKVVITGSADSKTGSAAWNQTLSENRANAVADELVNLGVSRDNIEVKAVGGVDEVSPYPLNRRAVVELK